MKHFSKFLLSLTLCTLTLLICSIVFEFSNILICLFSIICIISFILYLWATITNRRLFKKEKNIFLFPKEKLILLTFGDEKSNTCYTIKYSKQWIKEINFMKKYNSNIRISISSGIYVKDDSYYILRKKTYEPHNFMEIQNYIYNNMSL